MDQSNQIIDEDKLEIAIELLRALSHDLRLRIIEFIDKNQEVNVNMIYNSLGLEQSITSQHLRILRLADLVFSRRKGKQMFYSLNYDYLDKIMEVVNDYAEQ